MPSLITVCLIAILLVMAPSALSFDRNKETLRLMAFKQMREAILGSREADCKAASEVDRVADELVKIIHRSKSGEKLLGKLASGVGQEKFLSPLGLLLGANPYEKKTDAEAKGGNPKARLKLEFSPALSDAAISLWRKNPPADWQAKPGTVVVMHNGFDQLLVFEADGTGRPVFDGERQRFKIVSIRIARR